MAVYLIYSHNLIKPERTLKYHKIKPYAMIVMEEVTSGSIRIIAVIKR